MNLALLTAALLVVLCSSCATTSSDGSHEPLGYAGTANDCDPRKAEEAAGRCRFPVLGYQGFTDPTIVIQSGGIGGAGL